MTAILGAIWARHGGSILIGLTALAVVAGIFAFGYSSGQNAGRVDQLKDSVKAYEKREGIDNDTNALGRDAVCRKLGGLPDQCNELRGLDKAAADQ